MMKLKIIVATTIYLLLAACSPVNSVQPFDQKQAAILIQQQHMNATTR